MQDIGAWAEEQLKSGRSPGELKRFLKAKGYAGEDAGIIDAAAAGMKKGKSRRHKAVAAVLLAVILSGAGMLYYTQVYLEAKKTEAAVTRFEGSLDIRGETLPYYFKYKCMGFEKAGTAASCEEAAARVMSSYVGTIGNVSLENGEWVFRVQLARPLAYEGARGSIKTVDVLTSAEGAGEIEVRAVR